VNNVHYWCDGLQKQRNKTAAATPHNQFIWQKKPLYKNKMNLKDKI
jgi:hypothetical protein